MSLDLGLVEWAAEAVTPLGSPSFHRMMGGATLYCDGVAYAIVALDALWFKADRETDAAWDAAGAERFTYPRKDGTVATMNYRRAPDACHDDEDAFREWASLALEAGRRAAAKKAARRR
ncbi:TfoX/Sxy family protein [Sphingomonas sp. KR1UV-12]|uniref:TfoX/Sxy family protein n=1 Tax=Sphingomonas aurea TaxID=3063994 RepID=A0ABT9ENP3_9SPHN|nr:TfoX/Sxy family protein [Sphingomonas sp. KR1UV-12]MDP1028566.1 TfoX/Sxy family protein [Sphingomonas sp. KR1UV-12]